MAVGWLFVACTSVIAFDVFVAQFRIYLVLYEGHRTTIDQHGHICRGIIPFVVLQITGLMLILAFPQLALWLPRWAGFLYWPLVVPFRVDGR
jgi:TRAP-type C4-dicarboxylate transport system permease large subunit